MVSIRQATTKDMFQMQNCNLNNLPENYNMKYYLYHALSWPQLLYVAEDENKKVVGYVMAKMEDEKEVEKSHGHITSISVKGSHRKLGLATKLMRASHHQMSFLYGAEYCSLHVRVSNIAAVGLYNGVLGYEIIKTEVGYYADGEDAYDMRLYFTNPTDPAASSEEVKKEQDLMKGDTGKDGEMAGEGKKKRNKKKMM